MRRFLLAAAYGLLLLVAGSAQAADVRNVDGSIPQPERSWINESRIPAPKVAITFSTDLSVCQPQVLGCAVETPDAYSIRVSPDASIRHRRWTTRHETGHIFDATQLTAADRATFLHIIGEDGATWNQGISPTTQMAPEEMFADHYALCAINPKRPPQLMQPGYQTPRRHRAVCRLIERASHRPVQSLPVAPPPAPAVETFHRRHDPDV